MADTQMAKAKKGELTPEMEAVALQEGLEPEALMEKVASGRVVIPANVNHRGLTPRGIGEGLRVKVNANIGTSSDQTDLEEELKKTKAIIQSMTPEERLNPHIIGASRKRRIARGSGTTVQASRRSSKPSSVSSRSGPES